MTRSLYLLQSYLSVRTPQLLLFGIFEQHITTIFIVFAVVQLLSHVRLLAAPWAAASLALLSSTMSQSLLRFMSLESAVLSNHLIP